MIGEWTQLLAILGAHHLWQAGALLMLILVMLRWLPLNGKLRARIWMFVFVIAALLPLAVFLPGESKVIVAESVVEQIVHDHDAASTPIEHASDTISVTPLADSLTTVQDVGREWLPALANIAIALWLIGLLWNLIQLYRGWRASRDLAATSKHAPELEAIVAGELPSGASIGVSDRISSPLAIGLHRPCILVPDHLAKTLQRTVLRDILRHEIAHVRRHDLWFVLAERVIFAFYWWSPFQRAITAQLELAREMACDEYAAHASGSRRYARSLLNGMDRMMMHQPQSLLAAGIFSGKNGLTQRIEGLLNMERIAKSDYKKSAGLCTLALAASVAFTLAATPRIGTTTQVVDEDASGAKSRDPNMVSLIEAVQANQLHAVRGILSTGADINGAVPGDGTALIVAARGGNVEMIDALLKMGAKVDQPSSGDGNPLIAAATQGHLDVVERLLSAGADINAICHMDETPLINASRRGHIRVVKYLVENGADVNLAVQADFDRLRSPLNQAGNKEVRDYLIAKGAVADGKNARG